MNSRGLCVGMNLGSVSTRSPVQHSTTFSLYRHRSLLLLPPIPCNSTGSLNTTSESPFPASRNHYHATSFQKCLLPRLAPIWLPVSWPHYSSFQLLFHVTKLSIGTTLRLRLPHHSSALPTTPPHPRETPRPWEELSKRITERG